MVERLNEHVAIIAEITERASHISPGRELIAYPVEDIKALLALLSDTWFKIDDPDHPPPLDRSFLGARVGATFHLRTEPAPDGIWHIRGRHMDYHGGPSEWAWNVHGGGYGLRITHWRELPELPKASNYRAERHSDDPEQGWLPRKLFDTDRDAISFVSEQKSGNWRACRRTETGEWVPIHLVSY